MRMRASFAPSMCGWVDCWWYNLSSAYAEILLGAVGRTVGERVSHRYSVRQYHRNDTRMAEGAWDAV